jgi:hypothetical protein
MAEETTQEKLLREFMNEQIFGDPHDFAARAEIHDLRVKLGLEPAEEKSHAKGEKGRSAFGNA